MIEFDVFPTRTSRNHGGCFTTSCRFAQDLIGKGLRDLGLPAPVVKTDNRQAEVYLPTTPLGLPGWGCPEERSRRN
jgi:hypothetical protein